MPKYIDFHAKAPQMPAAELEKARASVGQRDSFGVTELNAYFTKDGQAYCLTEAPNADAVCKSHEAMGMKLGRGDVHEISTVLAET